MQNRLTCRMGSIADLRQLKELGLISYGQFSKQLTPDNWQIMHTGLSNEERLAQVISNSLSFVCLDGDTIIGVAYLVSHGNPTEIYPADWAYIRLVGVHPGYRGMGICKQLMQQAMRHAKQAGEKTIGLHTSEIMDDARYIYESLGFKKVRDLGPIFGVQYWLYQLDL